MSFDWGATGGGATIALEHIIRQKLLEQQQRAEMENMIAQRNLQARGQDITAEGQRLTHDRWTTDRNDALAAQRKADAEKTAANQAREQFVGTLRVQNPALARLVDLRQHTGVNITDPHHAETDAEHAPHVAAEDKRRLANVTAETDARERIQAKYRPAATNAGGWQLQQITNPNTNQTQLVRVNDVTGETHPVNLPDGFQPGGQRQKNLTAGQQDELATMETVEKMAREVKTLGDKIGWKGVGGFKTGTLSKLGTHLGIGTKDEENLRNYVGNIQGTIAKLRGGTSFTVNEQKLLDSYTPTIDDPDNVTQAKLESLVKFIQMKRESTLKYAGGGAFTGGGNIEDLRNRYGY